MKKKTIVLVSSIVASLSLVGATLAAFSVTDQADPFGFTIATDVIEEDTSTKYTTLEWGGSTSITNLQNVKPGRIYKIGILALKSNYVYDGVLTATLTDKSNKGPTEKKFIDYISLSLYEGANTDVAEDSLPEKPVLASTNLGGTGFTYNYARGSSAGKEYSLYLNFDESAKNYVTLIDTDVVDLTVDWSPQTGDIHEDDKTVYFASEWGSAYLYAWNDTHNNAGWPGLAMTEVGLNSMNQHVYKAILLNTFTKFIFSDGGSNQTGNLLVSDYNFNNGDLLFYLDGESSTGVGNVVFDVDRDLKDFAYNMGTNPGPILHAWGWTNSDVEDRLDDIAAAGYKAVQIEPMQPLYHGTRQDVGWYMVYQPLAFRVANSGENPFGDKTSLKKLTAAADAKGIEIIVDVIANHLCGSNGVLDSKVGQQQYEPEIYSQNLLHNSGGNVRDDNDAYWNIYWNTRGNLGGLPDVDTGNTLVQTHVVEMLKDFIDCGVKGFRFDAAKHIETPTDGSLASNFWPHVIGNINGYGVAVYGKAPYSYGEILGVGAYRDWTGYTDYIDVTDYGVSWASRDKLWGFNPDYTQDYAKGFTNAGNYSINRGGEYAVLFGESHDNFVHDGTGTIYGPKMNLLYGWHIARNKASSLYFARPSSGENHGNDTNIVIHNPLEDYKCAVVSAANALHNDYEGGGEYLGDYGSCVFNVRTKGDKIGVYLCDLSQDVPSTKNVTIQLYYGNGWLPAGTYRNNVNNTNVQVYDNGYVTLNLTDNVAVLELVSLS